MVGVFCGCLKNGKDALTIIMTFLCACLFVIFIRSNIIFKYKENTALNWNLKVGDGGEDEMSRWCLCSSLVLLCGCEQSAQSLPAEADGTWPASSQHNICCYLIETILLRDAEQSRGDHSCRSKIEHGRKKADSTLSSWGSLEPSCPTWAFSCFYSCNWYHRACFF